MTPPSFLISYLWRRNVGDWTPANDVTDEPPARWLTRVTEEGRPKHEQYVLMGVLSISAKEAEALRDEL